MTAAVTDHCVIRFLERAYGLTEFIAAVRLEIASGAEPAIDFGAPVAIVHGCRLVIVDGSRVVTALPTGKRRGLTKPDCARSDAIQPRRSR